MFCGQCGQRIADGAKFCSHCGAAAPTPAAASPSPVAAGAVDFASASRTAPPPAPPISPPPPVRGCTRRSDDNDARPSPRSHRSVSIPSPPRPPVEPAASFGGPPPSPPPHVVSGGPADPLPRFDAAMAHGIFARIKGILLSPSTEWPLIAAEPKTAGEIYMGYVLPLVAIGVVATLLGCTLIGVSVPFIGNVKTGIVAAVLTAVLQFVFAFVIVWLISWLVDVLAPTFGGQRDSLRALKVTAYSYTPAWVAGVFHLIPMLGVLAFIAGLYGLYLLYLGLPVLMHCPKDKSVGYTIVTVLCAIVMAVVIGVLSACAIGGLSLLGLGTLGKFSSQSDTAADTTIAAGALSNIFGGKSEADRARVGDAISKLGRMGEEAERAERRRALPARRTRGQRAARRST
mgnify:CR=1 FL=1